MKWIKLYEEFQLGDLNFMSPDEIQELFMQECKKQTPDLELIKVILDNGLVDVNIKYYEGWSPLHLAVLMGNIALAEYLISVGADVNVKDNMGQSPLCVAVGRNNVALAELLISAGADVDVRDNKGRSPLCVAVWGGNIALVEYLISAGADVNSEDDNGKSPLYWAVERGNKETQALLKRHGAVL